MHRVAVLTHPDQSVENYLLWLLAKCWMRDGIEVVVLSDPSEPADADLAVLHVDLTHVPESWVRWAKRFPRVVNSRVTCTAKSVISRQLVSRGDGYDGPVIVKSDLNFGGRPEAMLQRRAKKRQSSRARHVLGRWLPIDALHPWRSVRPTLDPEAYPLFETAAEVPDAFWQDARFVVERFLPEREGEFYCLRKLWCFGDRVFHVKARSRHAIVKAAHIVEREPADGPAALEAWRTSFGFEFGKIDYVCPEKRLVILDVNPTPGVRAAYAESAMSLAERLAPGIHALL